VTEGVQRHDVALTVSQLGYIGIGVSDLATWKTFATEVLGLQVNGEAPSGEVLLRIDDYHHRIILVPGADDVAFYGWEMKDGASLDQMVARLRANGFEVTEANAEEVEARKVRRLFKFYDPDGIPAEIYFGPLIDHRPFVSPRGVRGFKGNGLGWGHMVLAVENPEAYVAFLTGVLGARISDYIVDAAEPQRIKGTFLHVNPRHHSIAIGKKTSVQVRKLNHIMVECNDIDDVGMAFSLFLQRNIPVGNIGRHTNDKMISFYGVTPSGFAIEYGYGGVMVEDEATWEVQAHRASSVWGHGRPDRAPAK